MRDILGKKKQMDLFPGFLLLGLIKFPCRMLHMELDSLGRFLYTCRVCYYRRKKTEDIQVNWQETKEFSSGNLPAFYQMFHEN